MHTVKELLASTHITKMTCRIQYKHVAMCAPCAPSSDVNWGPVESKIKEWKESRILEAFEKDCKMFGELRVNCGPDVSHTIWGENVTSNQIVNICSICIKKEIIRLNKHFKISSLAMNVTSKGMLKF